MANLTGAVTNGIYNKTDASVEATHPETKEKNQYDQEMFLKLLVAEMQYQDPLEPTSNTEYVSELASFSQIEAVQAVQSQMQTIEANSLVGQYVIVIDDKSEYVSGKVDYVYNDSGDLYLSINGGLYGIDQLDSVVDEKYYNGVLASELFSDTVKELPSAAALDLADEEKVAYARGLYDAMDSYTKGLVPATSYNTLVELEKRLEFLKKNNEPADTNDVTDTEGSSEEVSGE